MYQLLWTILLLLTGKRRFQIRPHKIRKDSWGDGSFDSSRTHGGHEGIDIETSPGQTLYAPYNMYVERQNWPYKGDWYFTGMDVVPKGRGLGTKARYFYVAPFEEILGTNVTMGTPIGIAQDISQKYSNSMVPHVHVEHWKDGEPIDPTNIYI